MSLGEIIMCKYSKLFIYKFMGYSRNIFSQCVLNEITKNNNYKFKTTERK